MSETRDERALRKPEFSEGAKVTLADGQEWYLPKLRIQFRPRISDNGRVEIDAVPTFSPEFDAESEALRKAEDDAGEELRLKFSMIVRLLCANYLLSQEEACALIVVSTSDPVDLARWEALNRALTGLQAESAA